MTDAVSPSTPLRCGLVVLAAGGSTRLGQPKQLLQVDGGTLLERVVRTGLASPVWPIVVVLGAHAERIRPVLAPHPVLMAENPAWNEGMASSLRAGLTVLQAFSPRIEGALVTLCDQPRLSSAALAALLETQRTTGRSIVAARYGGHLGAPVLFLKEHFAALSALTGDEGARKLIALAPPETVATVDLPELALDLDTPEDVATYTRKA